MGDVLKAVDPGEILVWVRAYRTARQLQAWREKGLAPQLHSAPDGWVLILDTTKWGQADVSERTHTEAIRYCTAPCEVYSHDKALCHLRTSESRARLRGG